MKAGEFHKVQVCIDPRPLISPNGTELHFVIYATTKAELDHLLTGRGWKFNSGFWYAPDGWPDRRLILPWYARQPFSSGQFVLDPADPRQDFLYCGKSELQARITAIRFGWRKRAGMGWTKTA